MSPKKLFRLLAIDVYWCMTLLCCMQFERAMPWYRDSWVGLGSQRFAMLSVKFWGPFAFSPFLSTLDESLCPMAIRLKVLHVPIGSETVANVATQMPHPSDANSCNLHDMLQSLWFQHIWNVYCTKWLCWRFVVWEHPSYFATGLFTVQRSLADIEFLNFSLLPLKNRLPQRCMHC